MGYKVEHIYARTLEAARAKARLVKNLYIHSGRLVSSAPAMEGNLKAYSFQVKE
jgi:hypothetical protein